MSNTWLDGGFFGTLREMKSAFAKLGLPDFWSSNSTCSTLKLKDVLVRWWPESGTVLIQGDKETIKKLRRDFLALAAKRNRTVDVAEYRDFKKREANETKKQNIRHWDRKTFRGIA